MEIQVEPSHRNVCDLIGSEKTHCKKWRCMKEVRTGRMGWRRALPLGRIMIHSVAVMVCMILPADGGRACTDVRRRECGNRSGLMLGRLERRLGLRLAGARGEAENAWTLFLGRKLVLRGGGDAEMDADVQERISKVKSEQKKRTREKKKWKKADEEKKLMEKMHKEGPQIIRGPDGVIYALDPDFPQEVNFVPRPMPDHDSPVDMTIKYDTDGFAKEGEEEANPYLYFTRKPRADEELEKQLFSLLTECEKIKQTKKGANEVTKAINRNTAEFIVIACDIVPVEIVLHLPLLSEDKGLPFVWVSTREALGKALGAPRPLSAVAVLTNERSHLLGRIRDIRTKIDNLPYGGV